MATLITDDFQVFIKPIGARCNLRCSYCYYLNKSDICSPDNKTVMDDDILEQYIMQHFSISSSDVVLFTWHGGEPLLAGIDFYQKALFFQKKYLPNGKSFLNGIQTNGTLITKEWCDFFIENKFIVGISIDGPEVFHNKMRHSENRSGSFKNSLKGYHLQLPDLFSE